MKLTIAYKLSLAAILLVILSAGIVGSLFYIKTTELLVEHSAKGMSSNIQNAGSRLQSHIDSQREDTLFLANAPPVQGILRALKNNDYDELGQSTREQWLKRLESLFTTMLDNKVSYLKIRFIDKNGQELIVVGHENSKFSPIRTHQLQNKAHRTYVRETLKLSSRSVYLSEINLNREHGKISEPHQEVLRSGTPVYDDITGELSGLLVIASEIGVKFRDIQQNNQNNTTEIYITNDKGGYLLHPDKTKAYGFDLGKQYLIQDDIPRIAHLFTPKNNDTHFILLPENSQDQHVVNFTKISFDSENPKRFIGVGIIEPYSYIVKEQAGVLNNVLFSSLVLAVAVTLLAILFAYRLARPIKQITKVMDDYTHHRENNTNMPVDSNDEIGMLARSYQCLMGQVDKAQNNLKEMNQNLEKIIAQRTEALEASESFQRTIVEHMVDGLITSDHDGMVVSFNSAASLIFGYLPEEVIGNNVSMLMTAPDSSKHHSYLRHYQKTGVKKAIGVSREVKGRRKDGSTFPMDLATNEIEVNKRHLYLGVVRDITDRKEIDKIKMEFISTVSHELRTPLTAIRGSLGLIKGRAVGELPEKMNELLDMASNNTERLLLLINDILDVQKFESGEMAYNFENMDVMPFLKQAQLETQAYAEQYGVKFVISSTLENTKVFADKNRLMQVMANLLSNAAKFSPHNSKVEINIARDINNAIRISVTDHGAGIPEEFQPKLFERFTQSDSSNTRKKGGTGLGLNISKIIVEKHGGRIDFISSLDIGTTFIIVLPELVNNNLQSKTSKPGQLLDSQSQDILIIENNPNVAALLQRTLTEAGYNADIASNVSQALKKIQENPGEYKAITIDLGIPEQNNIDILNQLHQSNSPYGIPLVLISAHVDESKQQLTGNAIGVSDWIQKPIDPTRLINAIERAVKSNQIPHILHVEDEEDIHKLVKTMLAGKCELNWTNTFKSSQHALKNEKFDLVLLDIALPDGSGLDLLTEIEQCSDSPSVVIYSAYDVTQENASRVNSVLLKSKTDHLRLVEVVNQTINLRKKNNT
ncbi:MAG: ATP-binding protein [Gammaproteobacteria bacterium]|nr:ATP-binding protein [Gammaproteobacteria bacterium]